MRFVISLAAFLVGFGLSAAFAQAPTAAPSPASPSLTSPSTPPQAPAARRQPRSDDPAVQNAQESAAATDGVAGLNDWDRKREKEIDRTIRSICKGC